MTMGAFGARLTLIALILTFANPACPFVIFAWNIHEHVLFTLADKTLP